MAISSSLQGLQLSEESNARNRLLQRQEETLVHMCYIDMISLEGHEKAATGGPGVQEREPEPRPTLKGYFKECFVRYDSWDFLKNNIGGENWMRSR